MSVVYFIYDGEFTKIGITGRSVEERMADFQSPRDLRCLGTIPGGRELEGRIHAMFASRRVRGEWFEGRITAEEASEAFARREWRLREQRRRVLALLLLDECVGDEVDPRAYFKERP